MRRIAMTPLLSRFISGPAILVGISVCCSFTSRVPASKPLPIPQTDSILPVRDVRVLLASGVPTARVSAGQDVSVYDDMDIVLNTAAADEWLVVTPAPGGGVALGDQKRPTNKLTFKVDAGEPLRLSFLQGGKWSEGTSYPGHFRISVSDHGGLNVVNLVDLERYVGCVVAGEVWPTFATEAYRAQAVIARTYVLYQMIRRREADWDISATQGSQVYKGLREDESGRRAVRAAESSRGIVCAWTNGNEEKLFSTYYSSVCGGMSQSAAIFGSADAVAPLAGGVRCDYCNIAPKGTYRWGPVRISLEEIKARLLARYPKITALGRITGITVVESTPGGPAGRAVELRITGSTGETRDILAERFRLAIGSNSMRSTDCTIRVVGKDVIFEHGRGFGHGLGLCQWGMQGQALAGKRAGEILRYYYPGSHLARAY